jgi:hypothetical protein
MPPMWIKNGTIRIAPAPTGVGAHCKGKVFRASRRWFSKLQDVSGEFLLRETP